MSLNTPYTLPCGLKLENRVIKVAMAEDLAKKGQTPELKHEKLYKEWADGGWGLIMTGNVQVDKKHLGTPGDVATALDSNAKDLDKWKHWVTVIQSGGTPAVAQLNHPGRQAPFISRSGPALAPSAIPLDFGSSLFRRFIRWVAFGSPKEMTQKDIDMVIAQFASAAKLAADAGLAGIELHGAHGYLISAFLSPRSNQRTDGYGGSARNRARFAREVIRACREATSDKFCIGIKINSADLQNYMGLEESLEQIEEIVQEKIDFLEISGGNYENATMMSQGEAPAADGSADGGTKRTENTGKREAFFIDYARQVREKFPSIALMVTGGFRSRIGMQNAIDEGACDMIGLGRPSSVYPKAAKEIILNSKIPDEEAKLQLSRVEVPWLVRLTGIAPLMAGVVTIHYQKVMKDMISKL